MFLFFFTRGKPYIGRKATAAEQLPLLFLGLSGMGCGADREYSLAGQSDPDALSRSAPSGREAQQLGEDIQGQLMGRRESIPVHVAEQAVA